MKIQINQNSKTLILLVIVLIVVSCKTDGKESIANKNDLPSIDKDTLTKTTKSNLETKKPKPLVQYSDKLLKDLSGGVWVSKEYKDLIAKTKSRSETGSLLTTYSDIIFDGDNILHCNYPYFMEEHQLLLNKDLSVGSGEPNFTILDVNDEELTIVNSKNQKYSYFKVHKKIVDGDIFQTISEGSEAVFYKQFAGEYLLDIGGEKTRLVLDEAAENYSVFIVYPFSGGFTFDVISLNIKGKQVNYKINKIEKSSYFIEEIEEIEDDGPIISKNIKGVLTKISDNTKQEEAASTASSAQNSSTSDYNITGTWASNLCNISFEISNENGKYFYKYKSDARELSGAIAFSNVLTP